MRAVGKTGGDLDFYNITRSCRPLDVASCVEGMTNTDVFRQPAVTSSFPDPNGLARIHPRLLVCEFLVQGHHKDFSVILCETSEWFSLTSGCTLFHERCSRGSLFRTVRTAGRFYDGSRGIANSGGASGDWGDYRRDGFAVGRGSLGNHLGTAR